MQARLRDTRWFPFAVWSAVAAPLLVLQHLSARVFRGTAYTLRPLTDVGYYLGSWSQFDGPEYLRIVESGYWYTPGVRSPVVWFPLYPLAVRAVNGLVGQPLLAGVLVAAAGGVAAAGLYWGWLGRQGIRDTSRVVAFLFLLTYPYGWYLYGVVHSDALFLALVLGAFLLVEVGRPVLAGVVGALATATRPTGLALIPALVVLSLERNDVLRVPGSATSGRWGELVRRFALPVHFDRSRFQPLQLAPLLAVLGVGSYMLYLGVRFGDPLAFQTNQRVYHPGNLPLLKRAFLGRWRDVAENPTYTLTITGQALVAGVVVAATPFVGRRFGWGYAVFTGALVAIPTISTEDFMGTGRYLMAAFPAAALLGEWLARRSYRWAWLAASGMVMALLSMGFARSWYLT